MILSFIIPVYNTEDYIEKCFLSIINQSIPTDEYEIIVVDDGSTDGSAVILSDFENRYSTIKVITQENRGLGAARNVAFLEAKGDYIFYVDSDDYILPNTIKDLIEFAKKNSDSDIICFNTIKDVEGKLVKHIDRAYIMEPVITGEMYLEHYILHPAVWSYVVSKEFLNQRSLFMPEGVFYEDHLFTLRAFMYAKEIRALILPIYVYYEKRKGSISNPQSDSEGKRLVKDFLSIVSELSRMIDEEGLTNSQKKGVERRIYSIVVEIFVRLTKIVYDREYIESVLNELSNMGFFPIPKRSDSWKHNLFRMLFKNKTRTRLFLRLGIRL